MFLKRGHIEIGGRKIDNNGISNVEIHNIWVVVEILITIYVNR